MTGTTPTVTADELLAMPEDGMRHYLVRGELRTLTPAGYEHGVVVGRLHASTSGSPRGCGSGSS